MAYKVVRVKLGSLRDPFRSDENDTEFSTQAYPDLDDYLSTMEERGWTVVNLSFAATTSYFLFITLHRDDS